MPETPTSGINPILVNRRGFLAGLTATAAGATLAACSNGAQNTAGSDPAVDPADVRLASETVPFDGPHQAGIDTISQALNNSVAFTVRAGVDRAGITRLMKLWTEDARRLCRGETPLGDLEPEMVRTPANLTITCGWGARLFDIIGKPEEKPDWLGPLPEFSRDELDDKWGEADLFLQVCCDDPITLSHATRHMIRSGQDYVAVRWFQHGFLSADGALQKGATPRNLFGVKDGTINPVDEMDYDRIVWIDNGPQWLKGGSTLVFRRIAMDLDDWEILDRDSREEVFGRTLDEGGPLSGGDEFAVADFRKVDEYGLPMIDPASHMARSAPPDHLPDQQLRRRAYNYDLAPDPVSEQLSNSGLLFICFQKDPREQFVKIQERLDESDRLNQWITHVGSAVFLIPAGTDENGARDRFWGESLLTT